MQPLISMRAARLVAAVSAAAVLTAAFAVAQPHLIKARITPTVDLGPGGPVAPYDGHLLFGTAPNEGGIALLGPGIEAAADEIITDQCADGGWGWPHGGCAPTYHSATGPVGMGLLHAYAFTGDVHTRNAVIAAGNFDLTFVFPNGEFAFATFEPPFLYKLSQFTGDAAYRQHVEFFLFDELTNKTYGPLNHDTAAWIEEIKTARSGAQINLRSWEFQYLPYIANLLGNPDSTTPPDGVTQRQMFLSALLDGLDTLDRTNPAVVKGEMCGLSGAIHGLALNGTTVFPPIVAPNHAPIHGMTTLQQLADLLAGYQNPDGTWYWSSNLPAPTNADKCTQTLAYAIMALESADPLVVSDYSAQVALARHALQTLQLPSGGLCSFGDGSGQCIATDGEALNVMLPDACQNNKLMFEVQLDSMCVKPGETIAVELWQQTLIQPVRGYQAFVQFDSSMMTHVSNLFTNNPYALILANGVVGDQINVAGGINDLNGQTPTMADAKLVTISFTAGAVEGPTYVSLRNNNPPSRFGDASGAEIVPCLIPSMQILIDGTPPVITPPIDMNVYADATLCSATPDPGWATATDNLNESDCAITYKRADRTHWNVGLFEEYPVGATIITWRATDCAGNYAEASQTVTVIDRNLVSVDLQFSPTLYDPDPADPGDTLTRCITFEFWNLPDPGPLFTVSQEVVFSVDNGQPHLGQANVSVPCGIYNCVTARDKLHALRRTANSLDVVGKNYKALFTAAQGDMLVHGDLNDDGVIDVLDFAIFSSKWGTHYPSRHTNCLTPAPHADLSGNGTVWTEDFTFIAVNFLRMGENGCAIPAPIIGGDEGSGVTAISIEELAALGMPELAAGDLDGDGWVDVNDIVAFFNGARPQANP